MDEGSVLQWVTNGLQWVTDGQDRRAWPVVSGEPFLPAPMDALISANWSKFLTFCVHNPWGMPAECYTQSCCPLSCWWGYPNVWPGISTTQSTCCAYFSRVKSATTVSHFSSHFPVLCSTQKNCCCCVSLMLSGTFAVWDPGAEDLTCAVQFSFFFNHIKCSHGLKYCVIPQRVEAELLTCRLLLSKN